MSEKKLILNARGGNYCDYYDHHFESPYSCPKDTPVWYRNGRVFPNREESFVALKRVRIATPLWGKVTKVAEQLNRDEYVVVYTDETYHQGLGKELMTVEDAVKQYPEFLCCQYIPPSPMSIFKAISRRYLMIGESAWTLEYRSENDWRSNVGEVDIEVLGPLKNEELISKMIDLMIEYKSPIFAIDVVPSVLGWLATDLNLAPGMHNSGIKDHVPPAQTADLIKNFYHQYCL